MATSRPQRNWIRPLPERLINKIAAGEVIERPAAVLKELVENSIDAGAARIDIFTERAGVRLIKVVDNGSGIDADQVEIAFSRHATSKISDFNDLEHIVSHGFRGEALPSIASVSRCRLLTRAAEAEVGAEIIIEGGVTQSCGPAPAPPGTTVEVENLFFNTPARRKFLKSETTEARHLSRVATALALGHCRIAFSYTANGRTVFSLPPEQPLEDRVRSLLGKDHTFLPITAESEPVTVEGYLSGPETAQSNRNGQFIFINGRSIQSGTLSHALVSGYGEMMPRGLFPVGAVLLRVNPHEVDVNVHPAKTEVRLSAEREVYRALHEAVKAGVRHDRVIPGFQPGTSPGQTRTRDHIIPGIQPSRPPSSDMLRDVYAPRLPDNGAAEPSIVQVNRDTGEIVEGPASGGAVVTPSSEQTGKAEPAPLSAEGIRLVGRFSDLYLLLQAGEDLYIVDQHTAHERVLFEENLNRIDKSGLVGQQLLMPAQVELSPEQTAVFDESTEVLRRSGFTIEPFGGRTVRIEAVPAILARKNPEKVLLKVLDDIASLKKTGYDLKKAIAQSVACRAAVMAGDRLSDAEAVGLLHRLLRCENRYSCPHGRPTFIRLGRAELDRQFGRG